MPSPDERMEQLQRAVEDYPYRVRRLTEDAAEAAAQKVTGEAGNGQVVVTVTGGGAIDSVRVTYGALRELDNRTLADRVMAAVNDGLERAEALMPGAGEPDDAAAEEALHRFEQRMDDLLYELDYIDRKLNRIDE
ncbi:YbaB/EbfC family nucleoid-associated protein [Planosporangium mesophilum]|nr:YbaB/EbfC family nucleoid-associated protein [Planosporangium mesophilum]